MEDVVDPWKQSNNSQQRDVVDPWQSGNQKQSMPADVTTAEQYQGQPIDEGQCQRFVEQAVFGKSGIFPSATDAANYFGKTGQLQTDWTKMQPGAMLYFNDPNQPNGHAALYAGADAQGNPTMISAEYSGVQKTPIQDWLKNTKQTLVGYVPVGKK